MAARLMQHALQAEQAPLDQLKVDSFGTSTIPGLPASENSVFALKKVGLDLENHKSKPFEMSMMDHAHSLFCMTESHRFLLNRVLGEERPNIFLMREFLPDSEFKDIPDPYGMSVDAYIQCRDAMVEAIPSILEFLRK